MFSPEPLPLPLDLDCFDCLPTRLCADQEGIRHAAHLLKMGKLLAFPTETVYGLGADAENPHAIAQLYALKGRPENHPVIVHIAPNADPGYWVRGALPQRARALIDVFWPGPLTLILPRATYVPAAVSGGQHSLGLRCPSHPVAQALLQAFHNLSSTSTYTYDSKRGGGGVAAPSANYFGHVSPTAAQHVRDEFGAAVPVLDGGACEVGIESTILDLSRGDPVLLRPGGISAVQLANVLGEMPQQPAIVDPTLPRASGMLKVHYAPYIPMWLLNADEITYALNQLHPHPPDECIALILCACPIAPWDKFPYLQVIVASKDPNTYARNLYSLLRKLEYTKNVSRILVEKPPDTPAWAAIHDRLKRAAAAF